MQPAGLPGANSGGKGGNGSPNSFRSPMQILGGGIGSLAFDNSPGMSMFLPNEKKVAGKAAGGVGFAARSFMGLPGRDHAEIRRKVILAVSTDKVAKGRTPEHIAAFKELSDFLTAEVAARRANPTDDLITHLAEAEIDGDRPERARKRAHHRDLRDGRRGIAIELHERVRAQFA